MSLKRDIICKTDSTKTNIWAIQFRKNRILDIFYRAMKGEKISIGKIAMNMKFQPKVFPKTSMILRIFLMIIEIS